MKKLLLALLAITPLLTIASPVDLRVKIDTRLMEGEKLVKSTQLSTLDGNQAQIGSIEQTYAVNNGLFLAFTPTIKKNGKIGVAFQFKKSDLEASKTVTVNVDGMETQLPHVMTSELKGYIEVTDGKEVLIPFSGPSKQGTSETTQYTLKLIVSKG